MKIYHSWYMRITEILYLAAEFFKVQLNSDDFDTNFSSPLGTEKCILGFLTVCAILLTDKLFHMKAVIHEGAD